MRVCQLCDRTVEHTSKHHLVPRQKNTDGKTAEFCIPCSKQVHALFTNSELKKLDTIEKLKENEKIQTWIKWISKTDLEDIKYHGRGGFHK
jgi:hypothetical protein